MLRRLLLLLVYALLFSVIGRNLDFLPTFDFRSEAQKIDALEKRVHDYLKTQTPRFSLYYKDLKTDEEFGVDEHNVLTAASVNKLVIAAYLYALAAQGKVGLEDKVVIQKEDIQDYGTGSLRYQNPGRSYTLKTLTKLALEQSDNTAAYILGVRLGTEKIQEFAKKIGLASTHMAQNKTTAADMGTLLELIYTEKITSASLTQELLDFLKDTDLEDRLPRFLDKNIAVYHKTGDAVTMIHDVGIIDNGTSPFILAVLTTEANDEEKTKQAIGEIAKIIYDERK